ncbi:MAG: hypothetical protein KA138_15555 [Saprospiraceae bacterium]|nr:hypothetical protein [Saprospiraceae bacterium]
MQLNIASDKTMGQVQDEFTSFFPNLKLVFFTKAHDAYKGSPAKFLISGHDTLLSTMSARVPASAVLLMELEMPVWQFERLFENEYGLHVQVFRRSGNTWLETSVSDDLTLEEQEAKAEASLVKNFEIVDPLDYRDQD